MSNDEKSTSENSPQRDEAFLQLLTAYASFGEKVKNKKKYKNLRVDTPKNFHPELHSNSSRKKKRLPVKRRAATVFTEFSKAKKIKRKGSPSAAFAERIEKKKEKWSWKRLAVSFSFIVMGVGGLWWYLGKKKETTN